MRKSVTMYVTILLLFHAKTTELILTKLHNNIAHITEFNSEFCVVPKASNRKICIMYQMTQIIGI